MENITTLLAGLLGGGALVQLVQTLLHRRQEGRAREAEVLGAEVSALQKAIATLRDNLDAAEQRHARERARLEDRILTLEEQVGRLRDENERLQLAAC